MPPRQFSSGLRARLGALAFGLALLAGVAGCATISSPTGGPVDTTPPSLVAALPADGSTNVTETTLRLAFSERIAAASAPRAVRVVPEGAAPPRVRVRGDEVEVRFDSLRAATTYVVTIGTDLADERNVKLASPITVAFATGDQIDQGAIAGVVRDPVSGRGVGGLVVLAYRGAAPDLAAAPDYRTEVGSDGAFRLAYLRPDSFLVFALDDRNRNGRADAGERFAAPPSLATLAVSAADSTASVPQLDLWVTSRDTVPPLPRRVRTISDRRFAIRFDEPVELLRPQLDASDWVLSDSASARPTPVLVYQDPVQPAEVRFLAAEPLPEAPHEIRLRAPDAVADSAGNELAPFRLAFTPSATADTLQARVTGFLNGGPLRSDSTQSVRADQPIGLRYSSPPDLDAVRERVELVTTDAAPVAVTLARTPDGLGVRVLPDSTAPSAFRLQLRGDSTVSRSFARLGRDDTGALVGTVPGAAGRPVIAEVTLDDGTVRSALVDADGAFAFSRLAPGPVRLRLFEDLDGDGQWSGGRLPPDAVPPEPLLVVPEPATIRARWDTEIEPAQLVLFPDSP